MQTETIDIRTDKALAACLDTRRPVAVMAYDYAAGDKVPVHHHSKAQLIYAIEGTMTVLYARGTVGSPADPRHLGSGTDASRHHHEQARQNAHRLLR